MPETLVYETTDGHQINEVFFRRTIKGIPSINSAVFLRNQSSTLIFAGKIVVLPGIGQSYSEDMFISESGETWNKHIDISISPLERTQFFIRSLPIITPSGQTGRASLGIHGKWI